MGNNQLEREYEEIRLKQTISLAEEQLKQAKEAAEKKKSQIIEVKKEVREKTGTGCSFSDAPVIVSSWCISTTKNDKRTGRG